MAVLLHQLRRVPQHSPAQARRIATTGSMRILGISGSIRQASLNRKLLLAAKKVSLHAALSKCTNQCMLVGLICNLDFLAA